MRKQSGQLQPEIVFVTGTDTGVGKTVFTGLLLSYLHRTGHRALATKPFCSGGRGDAELLYDLQNGEVTLDEINPFYFSEPLAPLVAARMQKRRIPLERVLGAIELMSRKLRNAVSPPLHGSLTPFLLIEGAGGLLSPLGEPALQNRRRGSGSQSKTSHAYTALNLITALSALRGRSRKVHVIVVTANRLGAINHTLLTTAVLRQAGIQDPTIVMTSLGPPGAGPATQVLETNPAVIQELLAPAAVYSLPFLGAAAAVSRAMRSPPASIGAVFDSLLFSIFPRSGLSTVPDRAALQLLRDSKASL